MARQSEAAKKYLSLKEELKAYDVNLFLMESESIRTQLQELEKKEAIVSGDMQEASRQSEELKTAYDRLSEELTELDNHITQKRTELGQAQMLRSNLEGQINVLNEQIRTEQMNACLLYTSRCV